MLADGEVEPDLSTVDLSFVSETQTTLCSETLQVVTGTAEVLNDATVPVYGWWSIITDPSTCGTDLPLGLKIGIGAWDPQLEPAAIAANLYGGSLYGLYTQADPTDPVFVYGAAGTSAQFSGNEPPVSYGPLPDGTYQLRSLYLLPLTP